MNAKVRTICSIWSLDTGSLQRDGLFDAGTNSDAASGTNADARTILADGVVHQ